MNVYTCTTFDGYYPVGTAAVVVAETKANAVALLEAELTSLGLTQIVLQKDVVIVRQGKPHVLILHDGNY